MTFKLYKLLREFSKIKNRRSHGRRDHTYRGIKEDFEMYSPLVKENGIIALHDIVPGPPENVGGLPNFWNEIKHDFDYKEVVK